MHSIPHSTNCERVALAAGIKGLELDWIEHDPADRGAIVELSGQSLVPVAEFGAEVVADSTRILERLEREAPKPALWPPERSRRALVVIFLEWFNEVWKLPPNTLAAGVEPAAWAALSTRIRGWTELFEDLLGAAPFLFGDRVGVADVCCYPFLRYAVDEPDPADPDPFHAVLRDQLTVGQHPALERWVARVASLPRA